MQKRVSFTFKKKRVSIKAKECKGLNRVLGLMFKRKEDAEILLFEFRKPTKMKIHSYFVFFPFIAVWLDAKNRVIEIKKVNPFTFSVGVEKPYKKLLEIPINGRNGKKLNFSTVIRKI